MRVLNILVILGKVTAKFVDWMQSVAVLFLTGMKKAGALLSTPACWLC